MPRITVPKFDGSEAAVRRFFGQLRRPMSELVKRRLIRVAKSRWVYADKRFRTMSTAERTPRHPDLASRFWWYHRKRQFYKYLYLCLTRPEEVGLMTDPGSPDTAHALGLQKPF